MLVYLAHGSRRYDQSPIVAHLRHGWSFQAVLKGPMIADVPGASATAHRRSLWYFPPGTSHGWSAPPGTSCEVAVAHFAQVTPAVGEALGDLGITRIDLSAAQIGRMRRTWTTLLPHYPRPTTRSAVMFDQLLTDLTLMLLEATDRQRPLHDLHARTVARALGWYSARMSDRPSVADVAEAVGCSESHLRRHFLAADRPPPLQEMRRLQADRATAMLRQNTEPISRIAYLCGYGSPSAFSRSYRAITGRPPSAVADAG